jgi:hypothetical protein
MPRQIFFPHFPVIVRVVEGSFESAPDRHFRPGMTSQLCLEPKWQSISRVAAFPR